AADPRPFLVELVRTVRRFAEQHHPCITDQLQQGIVVLRGAGDRAKFGSHDLDLGCGDLCHLLPPSMSAYRCPCRKILSQAHLQLSETARSWARTGLPALERQP